MPAGGCSQLWMLSRLAMLPPRISWTVPALRGGAGMRQDSLPPPRTRVGLTCAAAAACRVRSRPRVLVRQWAPQTKCHAGMNHGETGRGIAAPAAGRTVPIRRHGVWQSGGWAAKPAGGVDEPVQTDGMPRAALALELAWWCPGERCASNMEPLNKC